ncbi:MAG: chemotaxis protein CheW [Caulobacteraceae bacterium]|nr:chemotaxis protein CheW [Caulobacteraceae bacterium]
MHADAVETQFVTFSLDKEIFAAPVAQVREILDYAPAFKIPNGPSYLLGLIDVRGQGVPTLDLRMRLGMQAVPPTPQTRILVLDVALADRTLTLGLVADRVFEVVAFFPDQIEAAPDVGVTWGSDYIAGVVRRPEGFVVLVDIAKLLSAEETKALAASAKIEVAA